MQSIEKTRWRAEETDAYGSIYLIWTMEVDENMSECCGTTETAKFSGHAVLPTVFADRQTYQNTQKFYKMQYSIWSIIKAF